mgnify:CR=1 FL=1
MSIDNCDLRLWRPAAPTARPGSSARSPRPEQDPVDAAGIVDLDVRADGPEATATER